MVKKTGSVSALLISLLFAANTSFGQSPLAGIPGLALWLRADVGVDTVGDSVSIWHDQSGQGNDAVAAPGSEPKLISAPTLNNMPSLSFNGTSDFMTGPQLANFNNNGSSCSTTIFMVTKGNAQTFTGSIASAGLFVIGAQETGLLWERRSGLGGLVVSYQTGDAGNDYVYTTSMPTSGYPYKIFEVRKIEGQSVGLYANTVNSAQGEPTDGSLVGPFTNATYSVGFAPGTTNYLNGEIAEVIAFVTPAGDCLTGTQIAQVETYLGTKYSPTVHIGPRDTTITYGLCALPLTAPAGFVSYLWSTGATTNSISVSTSGTYSVIITDAFGALQYDTTTVTFPAITLNSSALACQGSSVELVPNISSFTGYTFKWTGGLTTDSISASAGGNYNVTVTDANSCSMVTNTETVTVDAFRSTLSLGAAASHCAGNRISLVTPPDTAWDHLHFLWSNGSSDSLLELTAASGPYSVTVTDANGCSGSVSVSVTITGAAPYVDFSYTAACSGSPFTPDNLSTDTAHVTYLWSFGDGSSTDTMRLPTHTYNSNGTYPVELTVTGGGCTNDTVIPVTVTALPLAAFQSGLACTTNPDYTFTNLSIPASGQNIVLWSWSFGYPSSGDSTIPDPTQVYPAVPDTYSVSLTVTQGDGCSATATNPFVVEFPPAAPAAPQLLYPVNGSESASDSVTFGWQSAAGAVYYQLLVSTDPGFSTGDNFYNNIYSNQKSVQLASNTTYYWKVTAFNPCGDYNASVTGMVTTFNPTDLLPSNLALWLRADSGVVFADSLVSQWNDLTANANNATATGSGQPKIIGQVPLLNYKPSVYFNSTSSVMSSIHSTNLGNNSLSIFIVARADGPLVSEPGGIFSIAQLYEGFWVERHPANGFEVINSYNYLSQSGDPIISDPTIMPDAACPYHIYGVMKNFGDDLYIDSNGVFDAIQPSSASGVHFTDSVYNLGHPAGGDPYSNNVPYGYLNGEIAEIIIYNTLLNTTQQQQVNNYLKNKYAPPVNLGPDIVQNYSLCPVTLHTGNRFAAYKWSTGQTSDTIMVTKSGRYSVSVVDVFNDTSSSSINVTLPYQGSNPDTDYVCHSDTGQIIQLINQPTAYSYVWYDSTSPGSVVNMNINADAVRPSSAGYYYTKITDTSHCTITTPKVPVIIDNFYTASLLPAYDTICKFSTILFNPGQYAIDSFLWQPIADTAAAPAIDSSGTYYLYSVDSHGCQNLDSTKITTRAQAPSVNFTIPNYCLSNTTYFNDLSAPAPNGDFITSYLWNYGGGIPVTDTTVNGQTSYKIDYGYGNYTVSLTITTDSGCFAVKTEHITILPSPEAGYADSANNSVYPYILCAGAGSTLQLTDTSSSTGNSPIVQRFWTINGVADTNTNANIQYAFPVQGLYTIKLEVIDSLGCADSITQSINVYPPFEAGFSFSDHCLGDYTTFNNTTQSLSIVSLVWNFNDNGNGPYAYTPTAHYQFQSAGTYDVELQLENAIGCLSTVSKPVKIVQNPVADFTGLIGCQNQYYTPVNTSYTVNDAINKWSWDIGGVLSDDKSPGVLFTDTGEYDVSLAVTTQEGCSDSITQIIEVAPVPTALFAFTPLYGTAPLPVTFTNLSTGGTYFSWHFGDGDDTITAVPQINPPPHTYLQDGNYNVELYAYNGYGCYDSLERTINVMPTNLCLGIESVTTYPAVQADGSELVTVTMIITNLGTRVITSADIYAILGNGANLEQNWSGYLPSGHSVLDTIPAQFVIAPGYANTYVCVSATNINGGEVEANCGSNEACASLTGTMQLVGPSPNPAGATCQLGIILPAAGTVYIAIVDELGRYVVPEFASNLPAERTDYNIPVGQLLGGEYFIRVRYNDDTEVRGFVTR